MSVSVSGCERKVRRARQQQQHKTDSQTDRQTNKQRKQESECVIDRIDTIRVRIRRTDRDFLSRCRNRITTWQKKKFTTEREIFYVKEARKIAWNGVPCYGTAFASTSTLDHGQSLSSFLRCPSRKANARLPVNQSQDLPDIQPVPSHIATQATNQTQSGTCLAAARCRLPTRQTKKANKRSTTA